MRRLSTLVFSSWHFYLKQKLKIPREILFIKIFDKGFLRLSTWICVGGVLGLEENFIVNITKYEMLLKPTLIFIKLC